MQEIGVKKGDGEYWYFGEERSDLIWWKELMKRMNCEMNKIIIGKLKLEHRTKSIL